MKRRNGGYCRKGLHLLTNALRSGACGQCQATYRAVRLAKARTSQPARRVGIRKGAWPGLAHVMRYGLPGYPPPRLTDPIVRQSRRSVDFSEL